jgi:hypothetical protein
LKKIEKPFTKWARFRCKVKSPAAGGPRNGMITFGPSDSAYLLEKAGVDIAAGECLVNHRRFGLRYEESIRKAASFNADNIFDILVEVNLDAREIHLVMDGTEMQAPLVRPFSEIGYYGYYTAGTTTIFGEMEVSGE